MTILKDGKILESIEYLLNEFYDEHGQILTEAPSARSKKAQYYNVACSFDIETTSFYENGEKRAIMYEWSFAVNDVVAIGRSWEEYFDFLQVLRDHLELNLKKRLMIWVHNLAYEFAFLERRQNWTKIFAMDAHKPIYAVDDTGIEYRCSLFLTNYKLSNLAKQIRNSTIRKMDGDLDYSLLRNQNTILSEKELQYCVNDVLIVTEYIRQCIADEGSLDRIPLTKTGYVRRLCREQTINGENGKKYMRNIRELTLTTEIYLELKRAFAGGFTHASPYNCGKTCANVCSYDECSAYPAMMVAKKFPISAGERVKIESNEQFQMCLKRYCCLFDVEFIGIESRDFIDHPISFSKCRNVIEYQLDNGRVVRADQLQTTVTEQDFFIIQRFYKWQSFKIKNFVRFEKGYLPTEFVKTILDLFEKKTTLKGVKGKEAEYSAAKENLNSMYGMCVTDIYRPEWVYNAFGEWVERYPDFENEIKKVNNSHTRFLYYAWGVWTTSYARAAVLNAVYNIGIHGDYIYSDTDSVKIMHADCHRDFFEKYNRFITMECDIACKCHGIDPEKTRPKTIKGKVKQLGVFELENEAPYRKFKTQGAKRYMYIEDEKLHITIAGVNKGASEWLESTYGLDGAFDAFENGLHFPKHASGKKCLTYCNEAIAGELTDYQGNTAHYSERSFVHMEDSEYNMSMSWDFLQYLKGVSEEWHH